jgi:hypothetical protein
MSPTTLKLLQLNGNDPGSPAADFKRGFPAIGRCGATPGESKIAIMRNLLDEPMQFRQPRTRASLI